MNIFTYDKPKYHIKWEKKSKMRYIVTRRFGMRGVLKEEQNQNCQKQPKHPVSVSIRTASCSFFNCLMELILFPIGRQLVHFQMLQSFQLGLQLACQKSMGLPLVFHCIFQFCTDVLDTLWATHNRRHFHIGNKLQALSESALT